MPEGRGPRGATPRPRSGAATRGDTQRPRSGAATRGATPRPRSGAAMIGVTPYPRSGATTRGVIPRLRSGAAAQRRYSTPLSPRPRAAAGRMKGYMILYYLRKIHYFKNLIKLLTSHSKVVSEAYRSNLSLNEDQMSHILKSGDYVY